MGLTRIASCVIFLTLFYTLPIADCNRWGWNNHNNNNGWSNPHEHKNNQWNNHGGGGGNSHYGNNNNYNGWGQHHQFLQNLSEHNNTYKHGHVVSPIHSSNNYYYQPQPQYLQSFNKGTGGGHNNFHSNPQPTPAPAPPEPTPSVSFSHTPYDTNCPRPVMGDQSKFELRCILPEEDVDKDCFDVGRSLRSGTTVILRCRQPYVNENGEIRIWVCEDGSWKGEFKSIVCVQEGYTFDFKNKTGWNNRNNNNTYQNNNKFGNNYQTQLNNNNYQQKQNQQQHGWVDERRTKPPKIAGPPKPSGDSIIDNLFPTLLDDERPAQEALPPSFPAWKEPYQQTQSQPEFQHPWFAAFEKWGQQPTEPPTTTTTTTTTRRPTPTTTRPSLPTTKPYGWLFTTTEGTTTTTTPPPPPNPYETEPSPTADNWNTYLNPEGMKNNGTMKCPPLRKRTGVQLECLSKTPVAWDESSFLVSQTDCKTPQVVGTEATYKCQQYYESSAGLTLQYRKCKEDRTWTGGDNGFACALECGKSNPVGRIPLITNGEPTYKAQWPWHAALFFRDEREVSTEYEYNCGATLINRRAVLTAAHCVTEFFSTRLKSLTAFRIDLGRYERTEEDEFVQTFAADDIIPHPSYNPHSFDSDLAIIILSGEVTVGFHVRPICYPQTQNSAFEALHLADGSIGTVVGFGRTEQDKLADILHMAKLKVISQQECAASFTDTSYGSTITKSTTFCAGLKNGTNVCNGDSGGGIYFPLNTGDSSTRWYLQGLVSIGIGAQDGTNRCDPKRFSVFTRISPYADWIVRVLSEREAL